MSWFGKTRPERACETAELQYAENERQLQLGSEQLEIARRQFEESEKQLQLNSEQQEIARRQIEETDRQLSEKNRLSAESAKIQVIELQNAERASRILDNTESLLNRLNNLLSQAESRLSSIENRLSKPNG